MVDQESLRSEILYLKFSDFQSSREFLAGLRINEILKASRWINN